jgi:hypothetical protein
MRREDGKLSASWLSPDFKKVWGRLHIFSGVKFGKHNTRYKSNVLVNIGGTRFS